MAVRAHWCGFEPLVRRHRPDTSCRHSHAAYFAPHPTHRRGIFSADADALVLFLLSSGALDSPTRFSCFGGNRKCRNRKCRKGRGRLPTGAEATAPLRGVMKHTSVEEGSDLPRQGDCNIAKEEKKNWPETPSPTGF